MDEQRRWFSIDPWHTNKKLYYGVTLEEHKELLNEYCLATGKQKDEKTEEIIYKIIEFYAALARKEGFKECAVSADKEHGILMRWK